MDKNKILQDLFEIRDRVNAAIENLQSELGSATPNISSHVPEKSEDVTDVFAALEEKPASASAASAEQSSDESGMSFLDVLDLSDDFQTVYVTVLRHDGLTSEEISSLPELADVEGVPMIVKTLARQGQLKKYMEDGKIKFSSVTGRKAKKRISDDIWDVLEG